MTENSNPSRKAAPQGGPALEEARLRQQAMFDEVVNEPVPDEFLDILRRADQRSGGSGA